MKMQLLTITCLTVLMALTACNEKEPTNIQLSLKSAEIVKSNNEFGFKLFTEVVNSGEANENMMISPLSVSQALSMALNGAQNQTFMEMQSTLGFEGLTLEETNKSNLEIVSALLDHDPKVTLSIANSVWYRNDFSVKNDFIKNNTTYYNAEVSSFDRSKPEDAKNSMNKWVDKNTNGKIKGIIDRVEADNVMFLINAVYFKAEWKTQFKKSDTKPMDFTPDNGTVKKVETMFGKVELAYYNDEKFSVIKLPYSHGKFNLLIYLPEEGITTTDIIEYLPDTDFKTLRETPLTKLDIWLPKFEFEYSTPLNDQLKAMGIHEAFNPNDADFSWITDLEIYISKVMHKTYVKTDEEGSEAAAATSITFDVTSIGPTEVIRIDRSFLFAIVEEDTESILFIGRVFDPSVQ